MTDRPMIIRMKIRHLRNKSNMQHFVSLMALATCCWLLCAKPIADFTYTGQDAPVPCTVQFTNQSAMPTPGSGNSATGKLIRSQPNLYLYPPGITPSHSPPPKAIMPIAWKTIQITALNLCLVEIQTPYGNMLAQLSNETLSP